MRKQLKVLAVLGGLVMAVTATTVLATHNHPLKAKGLKLDLAVAYNACGVSNDSQGTTPPLPACHPPVQTSSTNSAHVLTFGLKGAANVQVAVGKGDIKLKVKSADIHDSAVPSNGVIADGTQLGLHVDHAISTSDACTSGDPAGCTTIDLGALFNNTFKATCVAGKCTINSTVNTLLGSPTIMAGDSVNISVAGVGINDQDGDLAFTEGLFIP
jgi:hypothetical protein